MKHISEQLPTERDIDSIPFGMYEVSGHGKIDPKKYFRDKAQQDGLIIAMDKINRNLIDKASQKGVIAEMLTQKDPQLRKIAAGMIWCAPEEEPGDLIKTALADGDSEVKKIAAGMIQYAPKGERGGLIKTALAGGDNEVKKIAAGMIQYAPKGERGGLIKTALAGGDNEVKKIAAGMIWCAPEEERGDLQSLVAQIIKRDFADGDNEVKKIAAGMIWCAPKGERGGLITEAFKQELGDEIIKSPLYKKNNLGVSGLKRTAFEKDGSETTLVGGSLKDKLIIRHITPGSFLAWQKTYEDYQTWKQYGFDYVPIEPIQSYRFSKHKGTVDVFSGVLDLNLGKWEYISEGMFMEALQKQQKSIIAILKKQGIEHGHDHNGNFVLRFFRDKNGKPDISRIPRLYAIDFDQAIIQTTNI